MNGVPQTAGSNANRGSGTPPGGALWAASCTRLARGLAGGQAAAPALAGGARVAVAPGVSACITGAPRWRRGDDARRAREEGDAAALAAAWARDGERLLDQLGGAFALVVVDERRRTLLAAVDRLGQHALAWAEHGGEVAVAGSSRALARALGRDGLDPQALYEYVYFHMVPAPLSVHPGVARLPAAHRLLWRDGRAEVAPYWVPRFSEAPGVAEPALAAELLAVLERAVASAAGGAAAGAFLSGGLDSSTVAGLLARAQGRGAPTFTVGFDAEGYDETPWAEVAARHFGNRMHVHRLTPAEVVEAVPAIARWYDEPFGNASAVPAWFCARLAREAGVTRLLAGDGGDELFAGNERYEKQLVLGLWQRLPAPLRTGVGALVGGLPAAGPLAKAQSYVRQAATPLPDRLQAYNFLHRHAAAELFTPEFLAKVDTAAPLERLRATYRRPEAASDLNRMLYLDWQVTLADNDLRKVAGMCAMAGVEVAFPMLDDDVVALSTRVPSGWKLRRGALRRFYRRAMRGLLPPAVLDKRKHGFGLPFGVWLREEPALQALAREALGRLGARGIVRPEFLDRALELHRTGHAAYYGVLVWVLMMLELWVEETTAAPTSERGCA